MVMCMVIGRPHPTVVFTDNANNPNIPSSTTHTYTNLNIGTADASRAVIVGCHGGEAITGVTVGGVAATRVATSSGSNADWIGIFVASVPTGTTATVVVTTAAAANIDSCVVWAAYHLQSLTPFDTAVAPFASGSTFTLTMNTPANGIAVGFSHRYSGSTPTATWSGLTEDADVAFWRDAYTGASFQTTAAETPRAISVVWTTPSDTGLGLAASFS